MNILAPSLMDSVAFLAWAEGREGRYELANGRVTMMVGGSLGHALVIRGLSDALSTRLKGGKWIVLTSDFAVKIGPKTVRYPDVVVDVKGGKLRDLAATAPVLVAEVLSPSSVTDDLGDKAAEYLRLQSISAYLVLSQDEPKAWVWVRDASGFQAAPKIFSGTGETIDVPSLGVSLPLSEIYADFPQPENE